MDYGVGARASAGDQDAFVVRLDAGGNVMWHRTFGTALGETINGVIVDSDGLVTVSGASAGAIDLGNGPLPPSNVSGRAYGDTFVASFDAYGATVRSQRLAHAASTPLARCGDRVLAAADGAPVPLAGMSIDFLDASGALESAGVTADRGAVDALAGDARGFAAAGSYNGTMRVLGNTLPLYGDGRAFVTRILDGQQQWTRSLPAVSIYATALSASVGAFFGGGCNPGCVLPNASEAAPVLFALADDGQFAWIRGFSSTLPAPKRSGWGDVYSIANDGAGDLYVTGSFGETLDFGDAVHTSRGQTDIFFAKLDALTGKTLWSGRAGSTGLDLGARVVVGTTGAVAAVGWFEAAPDFGDRQTPAHMGWFFMLLPE